MARENWGRVDLLGPGRLELENGRSEIQVETPTSRNFKKKDDDDNDDSRVTYLFLQYVNSLQLGRKTRKLVLLSYLSH